MKIRLLRKASAISVVIMFVSIIILTSVASAGITVVQGTVTEVNNKVTHLEVKVKDKLGVTHTFSPISTDVSVKKNDRVKVTTDDNDGLITITIEVIIPEFPNIMLPVVAVMGIMFLMSRKKRKD